MQPDSNALSQRCRYRKGISAPMSNQYQSHPAKTDQTHCVPYHLPQSQGRKANLAKHAQENLLKDSQQQIAALQPAGELQSCHELEFEDATR